jgi:hypothetical protein
LRDGSVINPSPLWWHGAGRWILRHSELCVRILLRLRRLAWPVENRTVGRTRMRARVAQRWN